MNKVEVCLTPELIHQCELEGKIAVVVDIFRATSCMVAGLANNVKAIYPVAEVGECIKLGQLGKVMAGERGGKKVPEFEIGNSPFEYMQPEMAGKEIAVSTTNGTQAIVKSLGAAEIIIGAFLNLQAVANHLANSGKDVVIHCAGWKGTVNLEDTLFAGALIQAIAETHTSEGDPALVAKAVYEINKSDLVAAAKNSSHAHRLASFGVEKDLEYCMQESVLDVVPSYKEGVITVS